MRALPSHNGRITMYDSPSFAQGGYADPATARSTHFTLSRTFVNHSRYAIATPRGAESAYKASCGHEWW
jgi:hypothetical protein